MQLPKDMQHSWNKMYKKYSADTAICIRKKMARTVLFKLPYSSYSNLDTVNFVMFIWEMWTGHSRKFINPYNLFLGIFKNHSKTCINSNVSISVNNEQKLTSNTPKSKLAFPVFNEIYLSLIASLALKLLRIKPEYFFLGHPVYIFIL
jgi:hypothetical protein